jgi:hypothetical protein
MPSGYKAAVTVGVLREQRKVHPTRMLASKKRA